MKDFIQRIKDWIIKKLGGYTAAAYNELQGYHEETKEDLHTLSKEYKQLYEAHGKLNNLHIMLAEEYGECREILVGLETLKSKLETFHATTKVLKLDRTEKQIRKEIEAKKAQATTSLVSDLFMRDRFVIVNVEDKGKYIEVTATVTALEGGAIDAETQLSENAGGEGGTQEGVESPKDD